MWSDPHHIHYICNPKWGYKQGSILGYESVMWYKTLQFADIVKLIHLLYIAMDIAQTTSAIFWSNWPTQ